MFVHQPRNGPVSTPAERDGPPAPSRPCGEPAAGCYRQWRRSCFPPTHPSSQPSGTAIGLLPALICTFLAQKNESEYEYESVYYSLTGGRRALRRKVNVSFPEEGGGSWISAVVVPPAPPHRVTGVGQQPSNRVGSPPSPDMAGEGPRGTGKIGLLFWIRFSTCSMAGNIWKGNRGASVAVFNLAANGVKGEEVGEGEKE